MADMRRQEPLALENIAFLAGYEKEQYEQPVLCVCSTRSKTRKLATQIAQRFAPLEPLPQPIRAITDLIDRKYQYLRPLKDALQRGVAYHNSSLPLDVREGIERAVETRAIGVVAATTTLAEGVDLPFRVTILADWLIFDGNKDRPMESWLFKNIAGRCGRAGQFTEGDTVVFDNPVGDPQLTSPARRPILQEDIFFAESQPVLTSAIDRIDRKVSIAALGSQLLAAIGENPHVEDLALSFRKHSFAHQTDDAGFGRATDNFWHTKGSSIRTDGQPLAMAASPVQLTPFGQAANLGGLSPGTARRLRSALGEITEQGSSRADLVAISVSLLKSLAGVPEQRNPDLRRAVANASSRPVVRLDELELVLDLWLAGKSFETIFAALPANRRSRRQPGLQEWLQGISEDSTWNDRFAKFYDFMNNCVEFFLPWILRASRLLAEIDGQQERPWSEWARFVELGVGSTWGSLLIDEGAITERTVALQIGQRIDALGPDNEPTVEQFWQVLIETMEAEHIEQVLSWFRQGEASP